jgi:hypothetical protein
MARRHHRSLLSGLCRFFKLISGSHPLVLAVTPGGKERP